MASDVKRVSPEQLQRNPENPRLIFRSADLKALENSIENQGILVPLTVYSDDSDLFILDGERRWRCALRLRLKTVPVIVQPRPERMQNIMMMFAIHNARKDWDPLPTALKLADLEAVAEKANGRKPNESELAELASLTRGEVRRLKKLLALPQEYRDQLMAELEKPRHQQVLTVDHVLEATKGAEALSRRGVISADEEDSLRKAVIHKFQDGTVRNTVEPRKLARMGRAVERGEVAKDDVRRATLRLVDEHSYSIEDAFNDSAAGADLDHATEQLAARLTSRLREAADGQVGDLSVELIATLRELRNVIDRVVR